MNIYHFQVKIWFQNRRARERRDRDENPDNPSLGQPQNNPSVVPTSPSSRTPPTHSTGNPEGSDRTSPGASTPTTSLPGFPINKEHLAAVHNRLAMIPPNMAACHPNDVRHPNDLILNGLAAHWSPGVNPMLWPLLPAHSGPAAQLTRALFPRAGSNSAFTAVPHVTRQF